MFKFLQKKSGYIHRFRNTLPFTLTKNIVTAYDYPDLINVYNRNLSAVNGLLAKQSLSNLYQFAQLCSDRNYPLPYYLQLIRKLFYFQGVLRDTQLKTNPAYSLDPELIAKIVAFLSDDINSEEKLLPIVNEWKNKHKQLTGKSYPGKIIELLKLIINVKKEIVAPELGYLTETILLGFLHYKAKDRQDLINYTVELNKLLPFTTVGALNAKKRFNHEDVLTGQNALEELLSLAETMDESSFDLLLNDRIEKILAYQFCQPFEHPPEILQGTYSYQKCPDIKGPSCFETALHNLVNKLLFNQKTQSFDLSLLPDHLNLTQALKTFYESQDVYNLHSQALGSYFMNIFADNDDFIYAYPDRKFELEADPKNFILAMRYLLGVPIESLAHLSEILSTEKRAIHFTEAYLDNHFTIKITIHDLGSEGLIKTDEMRLLFKSKHVYLQANYDSTTKKDKKDNRPYLSSIRPKIKDPMTRALLYGNSFYKFTQQETLLFGHLRQNFILCPPSTQEEAIIFCQRLIPFITQYPEEITHYLLHIHRSFFAEEYVPFFRENSTSVHFLIHILALVGSKADLTFILNFAFKELDLPFTGENTEELFEELLHLKDMNGNTVLHYVRTAQSAEVLLAAGANPNVQNHQGETPLHLLKSHIAVADVFIREGADTSIKNNTGEAVSFDMNYAFR